MEGKGPPLRVLIAEDNADSATSLGMLLRLYGHEVELAADGVSACQAVQSSPPDVVLLDIGLPKMNGWQVANYIRKQCTSKRPFIIAVTGYGSPTDRLRSQQAGIDLHLVKPADPEELQYILGRFQGIVHVPAPS
jgi:CheY-like chemotaxis protein